MAGMKKESRIDLLPVPYRVLMSSCPLGHLYCEANIVEDETAPRWLQFFWAMNEYWTEVLGLPHETKPFSEPVELGSNDEAFWEVYRDFKLTCSKREGAGEKAKIEATSTWGQTLLLGLCGEVATRRIRSLLLTEEEQWR